MIDVAWEPMAIESDESTMNTLSDVSAYAKHTLNVIDKQKKHKIVIIFTARILLVSGAAYRSGIAVDIRSVIDSTFSSLGINRYCGSDPPPPRIMISYSSLQDLNGFLDVSLNQDINWLTYNSRCTLCAFIRLPICYTLFCYYDRPCYLRLSMVFQLVPLMYTWAAANGAVNIILLDGIFDLRT